MDPFVQSGLTLFVGLATLFVGFVYGLPLFDRVAHYFERRTRHLPPAE